MTTDQGRRQPAPACHFDAPVRCFRITAGATEIDFPQVSDSQYFEDLGGIAEHDGQHHAPESQRPRSTTTVDNWAMSTAMFQDYQTIDPGNRAHRRALPPPAPAAARSGYWPLTERLFGLGLRAWTRNSSTSIATSATRAGALNVVPGIVLELPFRTTRLVHQAKRQASTTPAYELEQPERRGWMNLRAGSHAADRQPRHGAECSSGVMNDSSWRGRRSNRVLLYVHAPFATRTTCRYSTRSCPT